MDTAMMETADSVISKQDELYRAPLPANESERLLRLKSYNILDTAPEDDFDNLVRLAAQICRAPIALITLLDSGRQWFKAGIGLGATQTTRDLAFCSHAIVQSDVFIVPDAMADPRFSSNPLVTADPHIRFYAGAPLLTDDGYALGTLCVIDHVPRDMSAEQTEALRMLSREVVTQLDIRKAKAELSVISQEHKTAAEALRMSREFQDRLIACSRDCIKVLDLEGRLVFMNAGGMEVLEICDLALVMNGCWTDFWHGEDREAAQAAVEAARHGGIGRFVGYFPTTVRKPNPRFRGQTGASAGVVA
jgi:PAS domain-containing protein